MLYGKTAVVFGASGAIGGAVAKAFAREGAQVFLSGRDGARVRAVARDIEAAGGTAEPATVDALDEAAVERHIAEVVEKAGSVDMVLNAMGVWPVQGVALSDIAAADFTYPIATWPTSQFLTARAAARHMGQRGAGVILTLSASASAAVGMTGGFGVACAAVEALTRTLAAELGPRGVRVACLRPHRIGETMVKADFDVPREEFVGILEGMTMLRKLPTLADVANTAVFLASDHAAALTGTVTHLTCGMNVD